MRVDQNKSQVVACLGSSTTAGRGEAYDWISELQKRPQNKKIKFYNFGVGGNLAYGVLKRVPSVIACRPDRIVVQAGGNDVLVLVFNNAKRFLVDWKRLPGNPSAEWFRDNLQAIIRRRREALANAIAACAIACSL